MKILVTGGTGFIGNHLVNELLTRGHSLIVSSKDVEKAKKFDWYSQVTHVSYDIQCPQEHIYALFDRPDVLIHLAWEGLENFRDEAHIQQYLPRHYKFVEQLIEGGIKLCLVTGTCLEYGFHNGSMEESLRPEPRIAYAEAKNELREQLTGLQALHHFTLQWVRIFYLYGSGQHPTSILAQLDRALDNNEAEFDMSAGQQLRDYLPVEDVARIIASIALQRKVEGIINCCSGKPISIQQLVKEHLETRQKQIRLNLGKYPYPDYEPMAFWGDPAKLQSILTG